MNGDTFAKLVQPTSNIDPFYVENLGPKHIDDKKIEEPVNVCVVITFFNILFFLSFHFIILFIYSMIILIVIFFKKAMPWGLKGRMFVAQPFYDNPLLTNELLPLLSTHPTSSSSSLSSSNNIPSAYLTTTFTALSKTPAQVLLLFSSGATGIERGGGGGGGMEKDKDTFLFPLSKYNTWMIDLTELTMGSILESGRNWEVFASILRGNKPVLVQRFLNQKMSDSQLLDLRAETATLRYSSFFVID